VKHKELPAPTRPEDSAAARARVTAARNKLTERYRTEKCPYSDAQMMRKMIRKFCAICTGGEKLVEKAMTKLGLPGRAVTTASLKSRAPLPIVTLAESIEPRHLGEALPQRTLDRSYWARDGQPASPGPPGASQSRADRWVPCSTPALCSLTPFPPVCYP
jgi:predicted ATPase with chaperone activity